MERMREQAAHEALMERYRTQLETRYRFINAQQFDLTTNLYEQQRSRS